MPRIAWNHVCKPRSCGNICNFLVWNDVAYLKSLWALASKKDRQWIKCVNAYYIKGADIMQIRVPMLAKIIDSRKLVLRWSHLDIMSLQEVQCSESLLGSSCCWA